MDIEVFYKPKINYAIGGETFFGLGVGIYYLITSILIFISCLVAGVGFILVAFISISNMDQ